MAVLSFFFSTMGSLAVSQSNIELKYEIYLGGIFTGSVGFEAVLTEERYELAAVTRSHGVIDWVIGFTSQARSHGRIVNDALRPLEHHAENQWMGEQRRVDVTYDRQGAVIATIEPSADVDGREAVVPEQTVQTIDPLSAALFAARKAGEQDSCTGVVGVFDGRRRYDLQFVRVGQTTITNPLYAGPALRCRVTLNRIIGFSRRPWLQVVKGVETTDIWFARVPPAPFPIPIMLEADSGLGIAILRLVGLRTGDNEP